MIRKPHCPAAASATCCLLAAVVLTTASCGKVEPAAESKPPPIVTTELGVEMVLIPAGQFTMGGDGGDADQRPAHQVQIDSLLVDRYETTQELCRRLAEGNEFLPGNFSHFRGPGDLPAEMVRWDMAALFCNQRSRAEGLTPCYDEETAECDFQADGYRLPTEAEWEYACRAGSPTAYSFGSDARKLKQYAWFAENAGKKTHPVGAKKPNAWGLFDMHGNVAEWCNDPYHQGYYANSPAANPTGPAHGQKRVLRGGSFLSSREACESARRAADTPGFTDACFPLETHGFRCVRRAKRHQH